MEHVRFHIDVVDFVLVPADGEAHRRRPRLKLAVESERHGVRIAEAIDVDVANTDSPAEPHVGACIKVAPDIPVPGLVVEQDEVAIADSQEDRVVDAIVTAAKTGQIGDGKIFVTDVGRAVRIRTGETDNDAL